MDHYLVIWAVVVFVESRVQSGIRYADLEKVVGFSLPYLRSLFSRYTGQPLVEYIMSRRISRAAFDAVHSNDTFLEISERYGFTNPDTFTRVFRRITGINPKDFRKAKPTVGHIKLCPGVYGVSVNLTHNLLKRMELMTNKHVSEGSVVLYGVPKAHYGAFDGCTPYPICLKTVANYMGIDLDYDDAIVGSGAAFRLVWDTTEWNGGNVDVLLGFDDPALVFKSGIEALGYEFKLLGRGGGAEIGVPAMFTAADNSPVKGAFITFVTENIDMGKPVIALGIIGPPEACVITGYRDNGNTLLGWNMFQDSPEFASGISFDDSGYFITSTWWENRETVAIMAMGDKKGEPQPLKAIVERAVLALEGRQAGNYAKGIDAYDAWKKAILDESQFSSELVVPLQVERLMCQGDGMDCLADGRSNASKYFKKQAEKNPNQLILRELADQFAKCAAAAHRMYETLGGWERGETQLKALMKPEIRQRLGELIDECKASDMKSLDLMKELLTK